MRGRVCVGGHCLCVAGMVGGAHKVNKVINILGVLLYHSIPSRQGLTEPGAGQPAGRSISFLYSCLSLVEYRDTVEVGSGSFFQPHVPRNKTQNIFSNTLAISLSSFLTGS